MFCQNGTSDCIYFEVPKVKNVSMSQKIEKLQFFKKKKENYF